MPTPYKHPTMPRKKTRKPKIRRNTDNPFPTKPKRIIKPPKR